MLYCPNPTCQALNSETEQFCQTCSTFLPRHYLWALGEAAYSPGILLANRYLCQQSRIFLDIKPGLLSNTYQELPKLFSPYLQLVSYPLHIPQVYDWLPADVAGAEIVLLDHVPIHQTGARGVAVQPLDIQSLDIQSLESQSLERLEPLAEVELLPSIAVAWGRAAAPRQLNWLWQIANLWQPLSCEKVAASLLDAENIRVDGTLVRLLELSVEPHVELSDLGQFWSRWIPSAQPEIAEFLAKLCQGLIQGQIYNAELLLGYLDDALAKTTVAQSRQFTLATLSDRGPTRQRNEDACYPQSSSPTTTIHLGKSLAQNSGQNSALVIVCDGIGGHQGGDVASNLAITSLEDQVNALDLDQLDPVNLTIALEQAVCAANDKISQQNDSEHRFERQRMGTTVVMALARRHELYVTHVGDSRVYLLTRRGCHQITLDDDVASREVRLGYSFYRQALHQPSSGSLVQALGMSASSMLYPTVQRLIPDEDCIFLLCSDGLSDNERVEEAWETDILPLLERTGSIDLAALAQRLVELGNKRNGYDNVTVGLIHYQVGPDQPVPILSELPAIQPVTRPPAPGSDEIQPTALVSPPASSTGLNQEIASPSGRSFLPWIGLGILLCGLAGLGIGLLPALRGSDPTAISPTLTPSAPSTLPSVPSNVTSSAAPLAVGSFILLQLQPQASGQPVLKLISSPGGESSVGSPTASGRVGSPVGTLVAGSVLQVLKQQNWSQQESWIQLRVCSVPTGLPPAGLSPTGLPSAELSSAVPTLQSGQTGWIREAEILPQAIATKPLPDQQQACM